MGFRRHDLQVAFSVPGTYDLTVWGYSTTDPLDEVLRPGYLRGRQALVRPSDLVYICTRPGRDSVTGARLGDRGARGRRDAHGAGDGERLRAGRRLAPPRPGLRPAGGWWVGRRGR